MSRSQALPIRQLSFAIALVLACSCVSQTGAKSERVVKLEPCDTVSKVVSRLQARIPTTPASTKTGVVVGLVLDKTTGAGLSNSVIRYVQGGGQERVPTDSGGGFSIVGLPPGMVVLAVTHFRYDVVWDTINVKAGSVDTMFYKLQFRHCP